MTYFRSRHRRERKQKSRAKRSKEKHIATSHDDTSQGAVHWFQDESGKGFPTVYNALYSVQCHWWIIGREIIRDYIIYDTR